MTRAQRIEQLSRQDPIQNWERIVELEDALRDILDHVTGWTRQMTVEEHLEHIFQLGSAALARGAPE